MFQYTCSAYIYIHMILYAFWKINTDRKTDRQIDWYIDATCAQRLCVDTWTRRHTARHDEGRCIHMYIYTHIFIVRCV